MASVESEQLIDVSKRIGIAEGKLLLPDDFDEQFDNADKEIAELFETNHK